MKLNKKGISLTEIIISVTLISLVIVFLLSMLITLRHESNTSKQVSTLRMNQAIILNQMQNDFIERELIGISSCEDSGTSNRNQDTIQRVIKSSAHNLINQGAANCLKFKYKIGERGSQYGYLVYYSYQYSGDTVHIVGYRKGLIDESGNDSSDTKAVFRKTHQAPSLTGEARVKCSSSICTINIKLPILAENGDDYGINLSYVGPSNFEVERSGLSSHYNFNIIKG